MSPQQKGTIQVDLDGLWVNLGYYGHKHPLSPDTVFESSVPRYLDLFDKYNIKATFFLVGRDGEVKEKAQLLRKIHQAGHEIGNHTYSHWFGFRKLSLQEKEKEIAKGEEVIQKITGKKPLGFKVPGYDLDTETLKILERRGYRYDSSVIPTMVYPLLMRWNNFFSGGVKRTHGPKLNWFLAPNKPYHPSLQSEWRKGNLNLLEIPCSVIPFLKWPYHATFATKLGWNYFKLAQRLTKFMNLPLNYEFHAADLSDNLPDKRMSHLQTRLEKRFPLCEAIIKKLAEDYEMLTSRELAQRGQENGL